MKSGRVLLALSILTRLGVILLLCGLALLPAYNNYKLAYNNSRLVELDSGKTARKSYELADTFFSKFGEPAEVARTNGGMTWSIRILGVPFTDPVAALSILSRGKVPALGFLLGLIVPMSLAFLFGRVFCAYICPASLLFFSIGRLRMFLSKWFLLPDITLDRGVAWGILAGGLVTAELLGHGIWILILPYFAIGQTLFHAIAMGTVSMTLIAILVFSTLDLLLGRNFTCRNLCPTGRLLGAAGQKSYFAVQRDAPKCLATCNICTETCPMNTNPKQDDVRDCTACGECLVACPAKCLSIRPRQ